MKTVTILPGDGIGPEVVSATLRVLEALDIGLSFEIHDFGEAVGGVLPETVLESIRRNKVALKGPTMTPSGGGYTSVNVRLRQELELYANVRPFASMPNVRTRWSDVPLDLIVVRENTEGEYAVKEEKREGRVVATFEFTNKGCSRIAEFTFKYADRLGRKKVCVSHKANIIKLSHGMFRDAAYKAAQKYPHIACTDLIIDNYGMQLVRNPSQFDVMLHTNLFGDIFSDVCAGLVHGSLGFASGANIGDEYAVFEAVHGTAPDIAGKGVANPAALMLSSVLMLEHLGMKDAALSVRNGIMKTLEDGIVTKDVDRAAGVTTNEWTNAVITRM
ncbi:MAG: NAD-dependent isocitrate dehydrogenase [Parcubacteria group bacterium]|nr:NAD-dependent isocitrate dehydrogenase [Candidatus Wildermuthbacteria bacterium]MBI2108783.1 NAD-dependent isocitrate dehydrogenase [Parcubacteria group bacterium]